MATSKGGYVSGGFDILKAPNAPTITSVATNIGSATVAFTAPTDVGGGAITSYTITAVDESTGASTGAVGTASPITISPGGGTFKIRAAATNIYGPGRVTAYETGKQIYSGAELEAWGANNKGQLGLNDVSINRSSPVQIGALTDWAQVSAGVQFTLAVKTNNTLWAWGYNTSSGNLGLGDRIDRSSPVQVGSLTNWAQVSAGNLHTVSVKTDGTLWAWGSGGSGQLGQVSNTVSRSSPVQVGLLTDWAGVSCGSNFTAAVKVNGTLWAWGYNGKGSLGDGTVVSKSSPVQVGSLTNWYQVSAKGNRAVSIKTDGTLWSWGYNNTGQLGDGTVISRSSPVQIGSLTNWAQVSAAGAFTASIKTDGTMWTWGQNSNGPLGDGTVVSKSSPVQVGALTNWARVSAGGEHTASIKTDGTLWAWGGNSQGALGDGNVVNKSSPVQIGSLTNWYQVSAGSTHTLALYGVV